MVDAIVSIDYSMPCYVKGLGFSLRLPFALKILFRLPLVDHIPSPLDYELLNLTKVSNFLELVRTFSFERTLVSHIHPPAMPNWEIDSW